VDEKNVLSMNFKPYWSGRIPVLLWSLRNGRCVFYRWKWKTGQPRSFVKTEVLQPGTQPISVDYRMALENGVWKAYDIMIEGVSLVTNYRTTFSNEIQTKGSLGAIIDGLAKRNAEALAAKPAKNS